MGGYSSFPSWIVMVTGRFGVKAGPKDRLKSAKCTLAPGLVELLGSSLGPGVLPAAETRQVHA